MDLRGFRKINHLTQTQLGEFLGIKKSFISLVENEKAKLPEEKFNKLLNNTMGWDTSMLHSDAPTTSISAKATGNSSAKVSIGSHNTVTAHDAELTEKDTRIAILEKENEMLRERLKDKDGQIEFLKTLINK